MAHPSRAPRRDDHDARDEDSPLLLGAELLGMVVGTSMRITFQVFLWMLRLPFTLLFALFGRHYVVRRNGKTTRLSIWRYW